MLSKIKTWKAKFLTLCIEYAKSLLFVLDIAHLRKILSTYILKKINNTIEVKFVCCIAGKYGTNGTKWLIGEICENDFWVDLQKFI